MNERIFHENDKKKKKKRQNDISSYTRAPGFTADVNVNNGRCLTGDLFAMQ